MSTVPDVIPVSDLHQDTVGVVKNLRGSSQPLVITQDGRAAAVLLSIEAYKRGENERALLLALARGEKEIAEGRGHDLDSLFAEADLLLADRPS